MSVRARARTVRAAVGAVSCVFAKCLRYMQIDVEQTGAECFLRVRTSFTSMKYLRFTMNVV